MGVCFLKEITMKTIIAFAFFLAVASADTCTDCTAVVSALGARLVSEHSLAEQDEIMVGGLCPQAENVAECEEQLPNFWESIALILWPAYYSPEADWMCAGICKAPEDHAMTCDECLTGIMKSQEQLLDPKTIDYLGGSLPTATSAPPSMTSVAPQLLILSSGWACLFLPLGLTPQNCQRSAMLLWREPALPGEAVSPNSPNINDDISSNRY